MSVSGARVPRYPLASQAMISSVRGYDCLSRAGGTEVTEMNARAALTAALASIGVAAAGLGIQEITFNNGTSGLAASLDDRDCAQVSGARPQDATDEQITKSTQHHYRSPESSPIASLNSIGS